MRIKIKIKDNTRFRKATMHRDLYRLIMVDHTSTITATHWGSACWQYCRDARIVATEESTKMDGQHPDEEILIVDDDDEHYDDKGRGGLAPLFRRRLAGLSGWYTSVAFMALLPIGIGLSSAVRRRLMGVGML
jgi:hypothetical protein